jgi:CBS domain-containing protein
MATVKDILAQKGPRVFSISPDATVLQAAHLMHEHRIGSLVVLDGEQLVGMFTERDVLRRVVREERRPASTRVEEVMTTEVACCMPQTPIGEARVAMKNRQLRLLPVVDDEGRLRGLVSIVDLNAFEVADQEQTIFLLNEYLHGRVR